MRRPIHRVPSSSFAVARAVALALATGFACAGQARAADTVGAVATVQTKTEGPITSVAPATAAASGATEPEAAPPPPAVYGLFPLWEQTGGVDESGTARIGMRHSQVALGRLTVGTDPLVDLYGTLNANAKLGIVRQGPVRLALQAGWYMVPTNAQSFSIGNLHASGFANPYAPVTLVPVAVAGTVIVQPRLHLHISATVLKALSSEPEFQTLTAGVSSWVEWWASPQRSVRLHAGAEGWPDTTQEHVGISFAWRARYVALQGGYARRFGPEGTGGNTYMFDAAVLFR